MVRIGNTTSEPLTFNTGLRFDPLLYSLYTHNCVAMQSSNVITEASTVMGLIVTDNKMARCPQQTALPHIYLYFTSHRKLALKNVIHSFIIDVIDLM